MQRFFFNTRIDGHLVEDPEGEHLRDHDHAWEVARAMIRQLMQSEMNSPQLVNAVLEVTNDRGEVVLEFPFSEALIDMIEPVKAAH